MKIIIIAAVAQNGIIGKENGEMPWHVSEEFKYFKKTTMGAPIIMGRKTFNTLGKPLKGRENIIISRNEKLDYNFNGLKIFHSLTDGINYCRKNDEEKVFIIGGGKIYRQAIGFADELIISFMKFDANGTISFPEISDNTWRMVSEEEREEFKVVKFVRN